MPGIVVSTAFHSDHAFSKTPSAQIRLLTGLGVEGDAHCGETVKHRSRLNRVPLPPNLRQVHLVHEELFAELRGEGFELRPGDIGENILTQGVDLLALPHGARLKIGDEAVVEVTGLRNPCAQLDGFRPGLMKAMLDRDADGNLVRKAGVMAIVAASGVVRTGDAIRIELPAPPHNRLEPV